MSDAPRKNEHKIHYVDERSQLGGHLLGVGAICDCGWHVLIPMKTGARMRNILRAEDRVVDAVKQHVPPSTA